MCSFFSVFINTFAKAFLYQILPVLVPGCKERFWCFVWWQLQTAVSSQVREEAFHPQDTIVGSSRNQPRGFDILGSWLVSFDINTILNTEVRSLCKCPALVDQTEQIWMRTVSNPLLFQTALPFDRQATGDFVGSLSTTPRLGLSFRTIMQALEISRLDCTSEEMKEQRDLDCQALLAKLKFLCRVCVFWAIWNLYAFIYRAFMRNVYPKLLLEPLRVSFILPHIKALKVKGSISRLKGPRQRSYSRFQGF